MGTAKIAPGTTHIQNTSDKMINTGFNVNRRASNRRQCFTL